MSTFDWFKVVAVLGLLACSIAITCGVVWPECRNEGHSFFYCLRLVSR